MSQKNLKAASSKPEKYCQHCGQKTFRPHRSVKELLFEFVENWFGYDSKAYKTARALCKPASLTLDYFRNSHHHNHYVTPIRLYIFLSIIFFLLTQFGGFNLTEIEITQYSDNQAEQRIKEVVAESPIVDEDVKKQLTEGDSKAAEIIDNSFEGDANVDSFEQMCQKPEAMFEFSFPWFHSYFTEKAVVLCDAYNNISYLPEDKQPKAKANFFLNIIQSAIESLPQIFLFTTPLLAFVLFLLYIRSKHLYVEHLVLLIHSHCFIFAVILTYLGWHQLAKMSPWLEYIPLGLILLIWVLIYLFMSMKRFYSQGFWLTSLKFIGFSTIYLIVSGFIALFATMAALLSL